MKDKEYVQEVFGVIHETPEPGNEEFLTSAYLAGELEKYGFKTTRGLAGGTGVLGELDSGKPGPVLGLRADMDALTYDIGGKLEHRHTCGHDAHCAMVMAAAREIAGKGITRGKLYIIFQPAEEKLTGAIEVISSRLLDDMTEIVGIHLRPVEEARLGQAAAALWHSASAPTTIKIKGVSAHGARPHLGTNAADAAILCVNAINAIHANPRVTHSIKVTQLATGAGAINIIPDEAIVGVDVRSMENDEMESVIAKLKRAAEGAAAAVGATAEIDIQYCPGAVYDDGMRKVNAEAIKNVLGEEGLLPDIITPGSEDFHFFAKELGCKAGYIGLGADLTPGLHNRDMKFNTDAMYAGAEILAAVAGNRLIG